MNSIAVLAWALAQLWLTIYLFNTLGQRALGVASLIVFLLVLVLSLQTIFGDVADWVETRRRTGYEGEEEEE